MFVGPVFTREATITPRQPRLYIYRALYPAVLLLLMSTAWLMLGTQVIRSVGDMSRFGSMVFQIMAPIQMAVAVFLSALLAASAVAQEKDKQTLILLLMTRLTNSELVVGKLFASLLNVFVMLVAGLPVFLLVPWLGGVSFTQVLWVFAATMATALATGSLGSTIALWREKTFQTLALTAVVIVFWTGVCEAIGLLGPTVEILGVAAPTVAAALSPVSAILAAARPAIGGDFATGVAVYVGFSLTAALLLNAIAILRVRVWNPSRELRSKDEPAESTKNIWGTENVGEDIAETARTGHVDEVRRTLAASESRRVWDNPVLWREMCTWAYGRKVLIIRIAYLLLFAMAAAAVVSTATSGELTSGGNDFSRIIPPAATPVALIGFVSLVIVNALGATSITGERDGRSLDLLLVTDLSPSEFVFGKLWGVLYVAKEMVVLPMLLCIYIWFSGGMLFESLLFLIGGLIVLNIFVAMLGIHCGMTYNNSRTAITASLGTVFFLFLGVMTCIAMMISFRSSFSTQLMAFASLMLGGGIGLFLTLGARNPSAAIATGSLLLPFVTFLAITCYILGHTMNAFLLCACMYGFTTIALIMPAIGEFDIALGQSRAGQEE